MISDLPRNWCDTTIGEVFTVTLGQSPPSSTYNSHGEGLPFFQGKAEFGEIYPVTRKWCSSPKKIAQKGDVLLSVRAPVGPTNIAPTKCCIGRGLASIRPVDGIDTKFILYFFRSVERYLARSGTGTTFNAITGDTLKDFPISLPPLPEQHRIVAKIEELFTKLDAGVENLKQVQAQLKRYRQSVLKAAMEGKLTAEWREPDKDELESADKLLERIHEEQKAKLWKKCKEPMSVNSSDLAKLPKGWAWIKLEIICEDVLKVNPKEEPNKQFTYLDIASIDNQENKITSPKYYFGKYAPSRARQVVKTGDILFSTVRTYLKNIAIVEDEYDGQIASTGFCVIRPILASNKYLFYLTIRDDFINQLSKIQRGTSYPAIRNSDVLNQVIAFPGLKEQVKIAEVIDRLFSIADEVDSLIKSELKRAQSLRQSILKRAFKGKLVPQDPNDLPASVLLERIKAEKTKSKKSKQLEMF